MAVRSILLWGAPALAQPSRPVEADEGELADLVRDLRDTCRAAGGVGLAAPQLGVLRRVALVDLSSGADPDAELILVNPEILASSGARLAEEGCLSFPRIFVRIRRPERLLVRAGDGEGRTRELAVEGLLARAVCHELDHLDGVLLVDRVGAARRMLLRLRVAWRRLSGRWHEPRRPIRPVTDRAAGPPGGPPCTAPPPAAPGPGPPGT